MLYTVGRTPWTRDQPVAKLLPTRRTTQTQNKRTQTSMPWAGFEPVIPAFKRAKTVHALYRATTGTRSSITSTKYVADWVRHRTGTRNLQWRTQSNIGPQRVQPEITAAKNSTAQHYPLLYTIQTPKNPYNSTFYVKLSKKEHFTKKELSPMPNHLSAVCDCLFKIYLAALHIPRPSHAFTVEVHPFSIMEKKPLTDKLLQLIKYKYTGHVSIPSHGVMWIIV
jgi:hypothetical protein